MTPEQIAAVCHEANRMYCTVTGDRSQPEWYDAPEWQKISAVQGVQTLIADPSLTPEQMHQNWMAFKLRDGWTYGLIKDAEKKQHPCMVEYSALPEVQKMKDHLFHAIVKTLAKLPVGYVTT